MLFPNELGAGSDHRGGWGVFSGWLGLLCGFSLLFCAFIRHGKKEKSSRPRVRPTCAHGSKGVNSRAPSFQDEFPLVSSAHSHTHTHPSRPVLRVCEGPSGPVGPFLSIWSGHARLAREHTGEGAGGPGLASPVQFAICPLEGSAPHPAPLCPAHADPSYPCSFPGPPERSRSCHFPGSGRFRPDPPTQS